MNRPSLLLLDEPSSGLGIDEVERMLATILPVLPEGATTVLVSHDVPLIMNAAERVVVLAAGGLVAQGPKAEIARDPIVREVYFGGAAAGDLS